MKGLPTELIYLLIFGGILLFNFFSQQAARRRQAEAQQEEEQEVPHDEPLPEDPPDIWGRPPETQSALWGPATLVAPVHRTEVPIASSGRRRSRFSRTSLLGTKRDVQNAVVIATILGPCRGSEPPGTAPTSAAAETSSGRAVR